jgi:hypothetical protein
VSENWYLHECNQLVHEREDRIAVLEAENAALWAFVHKMQTLDVVLRDTPKPTPTWRAWQLDKFSLYREALRQYEEKS